MRRSAMRPRESRISTVSRWEPLGSRASGTSMPFGVTLAEPVTREVMSNPRLP